MTTLHVTQREALEAVDLLRAEGNMVELIGFLANQTQDSQLKQLLQKHQSSHQGHYNQLFGFVGGQNAANPVANPAANPAQFPAQFQAPTYRGY